MKMEKEFSKGFEEDIQDLVAICMENDLNSARLDFKYGDVLMELEINFYFKSGKVKINEE